MTEIVAADKYGIALNYGDRVRYEPPTRVTPAHGTVERMYVGNWIMVWWDEGYLIGTEGQYLVREPRT